VPHRASNRLSSRCPLVGQLCDGERERAGIVADGGNTLTSEHLKTCIQFAGSSVPAVELTALSFGLTIAILQPPVDEVEPG